MNCPFDIRALVIGAAALIVGYFVCVILLLTASSLGGAHGLSSLLALAGLAIFISAFSGFIGALFARARPLLHGTLGAALGASILLLITVLGARATHESAGFEQVLPFVVAVVVAFFGALVAVKVWPRHGL